MADPSDLRLHEDPPLFLESINFSSLRTGFNNSLVEKDYFCTLLLSYLVRHCGQGLVLKEA